LLEESDKEVIEALMDATGIVYADEDIRLSILRALEKKRIEEVKMVVNNYRVRFGYIPSAGVSRVHSYHRVSSMALRWILLLT
jgi:hypothetical protein